MSIEPISGIRPVAGAAAAGAAAAWTSGEGGALAQQALAAALAQDSAAPEGLAAVLAQGPAAPHAAEAVTASSQAAAGPAAAPAVSSLASQALWPGSDWAQATTPAVSQPKPAPESAVQGMARPPALAAASASADALHLPVQARERIASPISAQRSEPALQSSPTESAPTSPTPIGAPARAPELAATPVQLSALHLEQAAAAHVQAHHSKAPEVERDPQRRQRRDLPDVNPEEPEPPPQHAPWQPEPQTTPAPESAPAQGWRFSELWALLRLGGQRDALRELDQRRRLLVCLPPRQGERLEGGARRWRLCLLGMDVQGRGHLLESSSLWWPAAGSQTEQWQSWSAHREQSAAGQDRIVVRSAGAETVPALQIRLDVRAARLHAAPPEGTECIDLLDPRGALRALGGQWSVTLMRAPQHLDPQHMSTCLQSSPQAGAPGMRAPDAELLP